MKLASRRISGVKNFESHTTSLLRGLPLSQVQSAYANGAAGSVLAGAAWACVCLVEVAVTGGLAAFSSTEGSRGLDSDSATPEPVALAAPVESDGPCCARSCASSSWMRKRIRSSSFKISAFNLLELAEGSLFEPVRALVPVASSSLIFWFAATCANNPLGTTLKHIA